MLPELLQLLTFRGWFNLLLLILECAHVIYYLLHVSTFELRFLATICGIRVTISPHSEG